jgi:hypothetical protein
MRSTGGANRPEQRKLNRILTAQFVESTDYTASEAGPWRRSACVPARAR